MASLSPEEVRVLTEREGRDDWIGAMYLLAEPRDELALWGALDYFLLGMIVLIFWRV